MNKRIRELAELASHQSPDGYSVTIPYSKDFVEKFAKLIVQECVTTLGTYESTWSHEKQMELLKKYFGTDNEKDTGQS